MHATPVQKNMLDMLEKQAASTSSTAFYQPIHLSHTEILIPMLHLISLCAVRGLT